MNVSMNILILIQSCIFEDRTNEQWNDWSNYFEKGLTRKEYNIFYGKLWEELIKIELQLRGLDFKIKSMILSLKKQMSDKKGISAVLKLWKKIMLAKLDIFNLI